MATKKQLAEQVLRKISGGNLVPDRQIDIREVMLDLDQLRDEFIITSYFNNLKAEGTHAIDQAFLSSYAGISVTAGKFDLPANPISLPRNLGIYSIYVNNLTETGTVSSNIDEAPGAITTITDSSKSWTVNQLVGRTFSFTSGTYSGNSATILSNTSNTITFLILADPPAVESGDLVGNTYSISASVAKEAIITQQGAGFIYGSKTEYNVTSQYYVFIRDQVGIFKNTYVSNVDVVMVASSKDILESADFPLSPEAESSILDRLFEKYVPAKQIPHDEVSDGQK